MGSPQGRQEDVVEIALDRTVWSFFILSTRLRFSIIVFVIWSSTCGELDVLLCVAGVS